MSITDRESFLAMEPVATTAMESGDRSDDQQSVNSDGWEAAGAAAETITAQAQAQVAQMAEASSERLGTTAMEPGYRSDDQESLSSNDSGAAGAVASTTLDTMGARTQAKINDSKAAIAKKAKEIESKAKKQSTEAMAKKEEFEKRAKDLKKDVMKKKNDVEKRAKKVADESTAEVANKAKEVASKAIEQKDAIKKQATAAIAKKEEFEKRAKDVVNDVMVVRKEALTAKVDQAREAALVKKAEIESKAAKIKDDIAMKTNMLQAKTSETREQIGAIYADVGDAFEPVRRHLPRKRVIAAGLGATAALAGLGYWIYRTYYADGSETIEIVACDDAAATSSWSLASLMPGRLFGTSSAELMTDDVCDEVSNVLSSVSGMVESNKAADVIQSGRDMAMGAVSGIIENDSLQTAVRGIHRELFTQADSLATLVAKQQKAIMEYLSTRSN